MGNCSFKGIADGFPNSIRVLTDSGTILELKSPKLAREVLENYPGYGIFPRGHASSPLADHERLVSGQFYYLLPLEKQQKQQVQVAEKLDLKWVEQMEPPKMSSADFVDSLASGSAFEVLPSQGNGVWKVKLVISTKQLEEIFSEEVNTEALIEKMRMAASSASLTPRRTKNSWVVGWRKPALFNVFKVPTETGK
ncbi:uncharacterized protein LOC116117959 [Pistacia vera]|uniref:uncharacterized protein LOC116117959 n=1 Tax=Pistacia vera TaxID=55513 RepID=UPI001262AECB|nr:uncharacterized protein LOC116117959 [Pistacia vera]